MLRTRTIKVSLTKPKGNKPTFTVNKKKKRLILDLRYVSSHVYKDIIKFDDWRYFQNFLERYLFKFDLKSGYWHVDIFTIIKHFLGLAGKLIIKFVIFILRF